MQNCTMCIIMIAKHRKFVGVHAWRLDMAISKNHFSVHDVNVQILMYDVRHSHSALN